MAGMRHSSAIPLPPHRNKGGSFPELAAMTRAGLDLAELREELMRTATILSRTADMLGEALAGRARFEVREEARDSLAQARRHLVKLDGILFAASPNPEGPDPESNERPGTMWVERSAEGDQAWIKTESGEWKATTAPPRPEGPDPE